MDIPVQLRGRFYNTNMVVRCPNFSKCKICNCCDNYNQHNSMCISCESIKPPQMRCSHSDANQDKFVYVMNMFNRPMSHVDDSAQETPESLVKEETQDVIDDLIEMGKSI